MSIVKSGSCGKLEIFNIVTKNFVCKDCGGIEERITEMKLIDRHLSYVTDASIDFKSDVCKKCKGEMHVFNDITKDGK